MRARRVPRPPIRTRSGITVAVAKSQAGSGSWTDLRRSGTTPSPDAVAVLAIAGIVLLANFLYWSGLFDPNPLGRLSGLGYFAGLFDPNPIGVWGGPNPALLVGAAGDRPQQRSGSQALGHLAALDWTHLRVPWWNPYEGTGMPLAGEMQSGALFPPTLLLLIGNGQVYEYLLLELVAGISTYFLLRRISVGRWASVAGGGRVRAERDFRLVLACSRKSSRVPTPSAARHRDRVCRQHRRRRGGWWLIAVALALSIYAGFPGDSVCRWSACGALVRLALWLRRTSRLRAFATKAAAGVPSSAACSRRRCSSHSRITPPTPTWRHASHISASITFRTPRLPQLVLPYVYGPIWGYRARRSRSGLRLADTCRRHCCCSGCWGWSPRGVAACASCCSPGSSSPWPGCMASRRYSAMCSASYRECRASAFFRYGAPALEMAVIVLAALGLDGLLANSIARRRVLGVTAAALVIVVVAAIGATPLVHQFTDPSHRFYSRGLGSSGRLSLSRRVRSPRSCAAPARRRLLATGIVCVDALVMFVLPQLSAPRRIT